MQAQHRAHPRPRTAALLRAALLGGVLLLTVGSASGQPRPGTPKLIGSIAGNSAPLHTETLSVGGQEVLIGFYMWPIRTGQLSLLYVEGALDPATTRVLLVPGPDVNAVPARPISQPDAVMPKVSWHELTPTTRGEWVLEVSSGTDLARLKVEVEGPPLIPTWAGWLLGLSPLGVLAYFLFRLRALARKQRPDDAPWWDARAATGAPE